MPRAAGVALCWQECKACDVSRESEGISRSLAPLGYVCVVTNLQLTGLARQVGESWAVLAIPMASSNCRRPHITGPWAAPTNRVCKLGGSGVAVFTAVGGEGHAGRAVHSGSDQAAACSAHLRA